MSIENPYEAPSADLKAAPLESATGRTYGGIGRGAFFGAWMLIIVVGVVVAIVAVVMMGERFFEESIGALLALRLMLTAALVVAAGQRIKNLGQSPWWGLTILIPLYNLIVFVRCLAYPEGWSDHKTLDTTGKVIGWVIGGVFLLLLAMFLLAVAS
jgi:uncharacterized membrane protein YhaH (DUF805 family)